MAICKCSSTNRGFMIALCTAKSFFHKDLDCKQSVDEYSKPVRESNRVIVIPFLDRCLHEKSPQPLPASTCIDKG